MKDKNSSVTSLLSVYSCLDLSVGGGVGIPLALAGAVTDGLQGHQQDSWIS